MASSEQIELAAQRLRAAYGGATIAPMRETLEPGDGATAYAIQDVNTRFWQGQGRRIIGRKIGLTAKAVQ
ncbi:MAG: 2-keto-4-pentenoate hydratase, partial [Novosphingobium sp.]|nr:2-keto-4-pentenoate hydratase [Novosphingobium sp.]